MIIGDLVELLRILTRKNRSVISVSHVPVYLAAYNATLSYVDQRILQVKYADYRINRGISELWRSYDCFRFFNITNLTTSNFSSTGRICGETPLQHVTV